MNSFKYDYYRNTHGNKYRFYKYFFIGKKMRLLYWFRKCQRSKGIFKFLSKCIYHFYFGWNNNDIPWKTKVGEGLYLGHSGGRYIHPDCVIGTNCNINQNVTIGKECRGERTGAPILGNKVWVGANSVIVGKIVIGNNVLISPNSFVNFNVPDNSIVVNGNIINNVNATNGYINDIL